MRDRSRRGSLAVAVAVGLVAAFVQASPAPAQSQPPRADLVPGQGGAGMQVEVEGRRFREACGAVTVTFFDSAGEPTPAATGAATWTDGVDFVAAVTVPSVPVGDYRVHVAQPSCEIGAATFFRVLGFRVAPKIGPSGSTATGHGEGWYEHQECGRIHLRFDGTEVATLLPGEGADESDLVDWTVSFTVPPRPPGTYVVEAIQLDEDGGPSPCSAPSDAPMRATDTFTIPRPTDPGRDPDPDPDPDVTLTIDPDRGPVTTEADVTGAGFIDGLAVTVSLDDDPLATVATVASGTFTAPVTIPEGTPGGARTVRACQRCGTATEVAATTTFTVTPRLFVEPEVARPGTVVQARGDGFEAATTITLGWLPGIGTTGVTIADDGTFAAPVLVFHRDRLGERMLTADVPGAPPPEDAIDEPPTADLLVVPGIQGPPRFASRR